MCPTQMLVHGLEGGVPASGSAMSSLLPANNSTFSRNICVDSRRERLSGPISSLSWEQGGFLLCELGVSSFLLSRLNLALFHIFLLFRWGLGVMLGVLVSGGVSGGLHCSHPPNLSANRSAQFCDTAPKSRNKTSLTS